MTYSPANLPCQLRYYLHAIATVIGLFAAHTGCAQANDGGEYKNWYQIEVVIFSRNIGTLANEALPKNIELSYPTNVRYLQASAEEGDVDRTTVSPMLKQRSSAALSKQAFVRLAPQFRQLDKEKRLIARQRGYKILYHEAWRQPIQRDKQAAAVVIEGGEQFGQHFELEGVISVSLNRYLHATTNLWFTQFEPNYGQENYHWPDLPLKPRSLYGERRLSDSSPQNIEKNANRLNSGELFSSEVGSNGTQFSLGSNSIANENFDGFSKKPYVIKKVHTLRQSRKMRSSELHYLDHPLSGVILLVEPFRPSTKDSLADQSLEVSR